MRLTRGCAVSRSAVLLGAGRPLFGPLAGDAMLQLVASRAFPFGFVQNHYALVSDAWPLAPRCDIEVMEDPEFEYMRRVRLSLKERGVLQPA